MGVTEQPVVKKVRMGLRSMVKRVRSSSLDSLVRSLSTEQKESVSRSSSPREESEDGACQDTESNVVSIKQVEKEPPKAKNTLAADDAKMVAVISIFLDAYPFGARSQD